MPQERHTAYNSCLAVMIIVCCYILSFFRFTLGGSVKLDSIADSCPAGLTGADFYALCSDAMLNAVKRKIAQLQAGR